MKRTGIKKIRSKARPGRLKGDELSELRTLCYMKDGGRCCECRKVVADHYPDWHDDKYHMSHIKAKRIGLDTLSNVRTLCGKCHRDEHSATVNGKFIHEKVRMYGEV